jgi:hypothetical protein
MATFFNEVLQCENQNEALAVIWEGRRSGKKTGKDEPKKFFPANCEPRCQEGPWRGRKTES